MICFKTSFKIDRFGALTLIQAGQAPDVEGFKRRIINIGGPKVLTFCPP